MLNQEVASCWIMVDCVSASSIQGGTARTATNRLSWASGTGTRTRRLFKKF